MELKKVDLKDICGKTAHELELGDYDNSLRINTIDMNNDEKKELYVLSISGHSEFLSRIDDEIDIFDEVIFNDIEVFKSGNDPDTFYYVATIDDDTRIFADSTGELILEKLILTGGFSDLLDRNIKSASFDEDSIDVYCEFNDMTINLYASLPEDSCIVSSSSEDILPEGCTVLDVKVDFKKNKSLLTEDNKDSLIYLYDEDPEDWEYTHMTLKFKTTEGDSEITYFIPDSNIEDMGLRLYFD